MLSPSELAAWVARLPLAVRQRLLAALLAFEAGSTSSTSGPSTVPAPPVPYPDQDRRPSRCSQPCPNVGVGLAFCRGVCGRKPKPRRRRPHRRHFCRACHEQGYGAYSDSEDSGPLALKMGTFAELSGTSYELAATLRAASREPASSRGIGVSQAIRCLKVHFSCCFVERVAFVLPLLL